jgi:predicted RNA-binding Zn-ribbon protein involved in translation (DUF1610 family)
MRIFECPKCGNRYVPVLDVEEFVTCEECNTKLHVEEHGEVIDGRWYDRTKLIPTQPT